MSERFDTFGIQDTGDGVDPGLWDAADTAADDEGVALDPREAAEVLAQATSHAARQFGRRPTLLLLAGGPAFLVAYGAAWWSTRHQHPYVGPAGWALGVIYGIVIIWAIVVSTIYKRATSGVGGRSKQQRQAEGVAFAAVWVSCWVVQGALYHAGASDSIVYGIWPATAPLIFVGGAAAANAAARREWHSIPPLVGLIAVCLGALFTGPSTVWLVAGAGLCAAVLVFAADQILRRRAHGVA